MHILLAISVLAFAALLWATIAIANHIRRARRRRRRFMESTAQLAAQSPASPLNLSQVIPKRSVPELSFTDLAAPPPPIPEPEVTAAALADELPTDTEAATSEPELTVAAEEQLETEVHPNPHFEPEPKAPIEAFVPEPEITLAAEEQLEDEATPPEPEHVSMRASEFEPLQPPPLTKPIRTGPPKHPLASLIPPIERPDWAFFNKDMGDLSDPEPRSSSRPKIRIAKPDSR
jgi:hypothetical protein